MYHYGVSFNWSKSVQNFDNNGQGVSHYGVLINWSKCGQKLDNGGQEVYHYGVGGKQW